MNVFIYALKDPDTRMIRYVGFSKNPYRRYQDHLYALKLGPNTHKNAWLRSLLALGKTPILEFLDEVAEAEAGFWECEYVRLFRALGFDLTNTTDGGERPPSQRGVKQALETVEKRARKMRGIGNPNYGKAMPWLHNPEVQKKSALTRTGVLFTPEHRANCSRAQAGRSCKPLTLEHRLALSLALKGRPKTPEHIKAAREGKLRAKQARA